MADTETPKQICCICGADPRGDSGSVLQCGRCKVTVYCSKTCQKVDWPVHKLACPTYRAPVSNPANKYTVHTLAGTPFMSVSYGGMRIPAAMCRGNTMWPAMTLHISPSSDLHYELSPAFPGNLDTSMPFFYKLPVTKALGLPLSVAVRPEAARTQKLNTYIKHLTINPDPKAPDFGQPAMQPAVGALLLMRDDGRHIHEAHLAVLVNYLQISLKPVHEIYTKKAATIADKELLANQTLTPAAFAEVWDLLSEAWAKSGRIAKGVECPVTVD